MQSLNPAINEIHAAFCQALGYELVLLPPAERQWFEAIQMGMTPEDVRLIVKSRKDRIRAGVRHEECLRIRNIAGSDETISDALEESAAVKAKMRVKVYSAGKSEVLRATGRPDQPEGKMMSVKEVIQGLRSAVQ
jgi:ribosome maturation factor RimP